jgi:hypothetical protein
VNTTQPIRRLWWVFAVAAIAALVAAEAAQARPAQTTTPSAASSAVRSAPESAFSTLAQTGFFSRSLRPTTDARVAANPNPATYTDPTGDGGTAPDITGVVVSNDANNQITFRINVVKLVVPSDVRVMVAIDSDQNASTGTSGTDYLLIADLSNNTFGLLLWNGSDFVGSPSTTATASNDSTGITFSVNSGELGKTTGFNYWVRTLQGTTVAAGNHDDGPDAGSWNYQLGPASALKLTVELYHATKAKAGRPFLAVITVARSDGALADVTTNDVTCAATIGRKPLPAGSTLALGPAATCGWRLPKKSRGKTLHASVTVTLDGATVTRTFTARIK